MARKRKSMPADDARRRDVARAQEARRNHNAAVRKMLEQALTAPRQRPTLDDLIARLDHVYELAVQLDPPALSSAVQAIMASAKLQGLVVDKQVSMVGSPDDFRSADEAAIMAQLSEKIGSRKAQRFLRLVRELEDGEVIEGEAGDGQSEEDGDDG